MSHLSHPISPHGTQSGARGQVLPRLVPPAVPGQGAGEGLLSADVVLIRDFWNKNEQVKHKRVSLVALCTSCKYF